MNGRIKIKKKNNLDCERQNKCQNKLRKLGTNSSDKGIVKKKNKRGESEREGDIGREPLLRLVVTLLKRKRRKWGKKKI